MRATDVALIGVVGALGVFVAAQVVTRRPAVPRARPIVVAPDPATTQPPVTPAGQQVTATDSAKIAATSVHGDMAVATVRSESAAPVRDMALIRAMIEETPGTYMSDMIPDLDGRLVRWPDRRQEGLRIWVQTMTRVSNWDERYAQMARDAFDDWERDSELPLRFDFVLDSASADVRLVWSDRFPAAMGQRVGTTRRTTDQYGWLVAAEIEVAIHDSTGRTIPPPSLVGIVRHEAGHALGMGHSRDPRTKMFPTENMSEITSADRATLRLLYRLPPGLAR